MSETTVARKTSDEAKAEKAAKAEHAERQKKIDAGQCVVEADFHMGRAVNGLVCSYHAMHYLADGTRRS